MNKPSLEKKTKMQNKRRNQRTPEMKMQRRGLRITCLLSSSSSTASSGELSSSSSSELADCATASSSSSSSSIWWFSAAATSSSSSSEVELLETWALDGLPIGTFFRSRVSGGVLWEERENEREPILILKRNEKNYGLGDQGYCDRQISIVGSAAPRKWKPTEYFAPIMGSRKRNFPACTHVLGLVWWATPFFLSGLFSAQLKNYILIFFCSELSVDITYTLNYIFLFYFYMWYDFFYFFPSLVLLLLKTHDFLSIFSFIYAFFCIF